MLPCYSGMCRRANTAFHWENLSNDRSYPPVFPDSTRIYADMKTQTAFEFWNAGAAHLARMLTESTIETEALRERIRKLARQS